MSITICKIILILLVLSVCMVSSITIAFAFNSNPAGVVVDDHDITTTQGVAAIGTLGIEYISTNNDGNFVVLVVSQIASGLSAVTYEISNRDATSGPIGTILGMIDSGTSALGNPTGGVFSIKHAVNDWWLIVSRDGAQSIQVTSEGGIDMNGYTYDAVYYDAIRMHDNVILALAASTEFHTLEVGVGDGSITKLDDWAPGGMAGTEQDLSATHYNNDSMQWFLLPSEANEKLYMGGVAADGNITSSWSGSASWSFRDGAGATTDTIWVGSDYYLSAGRSQAGVEVGLELFKASSIVNITTTGTEVVDADSAEIVGVTQLADGHIAYFWKETTDGQDIYLRMLHSVYSDGFDQSYISDDVEVLNYAVPSLQNNGNSICQLGNSSIIAIIATNGAVTPHLVTVAAAIPPVVRTTGVVPVFTTFNSLIDGALYATGAVVDIGDSAVTEWGILYNTIGFPVYSGSRVTSTGANTTAFTFSEDILDLDTTQKYYVRAYACNSSGTGYGNQRDVVVFPEYQNAVLILDFEPLEISSGTISDLSGYDHDVSYTWLANPGSMTISYGPIDTWGWGYQPGTLGALRLVQDTPLDTDDFNTPNDREFEGLIGMSMINNLLDNSDIPRAIFWLPFIAMMIMACGFVVYIISGQYNLLPMAMFCGLGVFLGVTQEWFPWWYLPVFFVPAYSLVVSQNSHGGTHI